MKGTKNHLYASVIFFIAIFLIPAFASAYEVFGCWTSHEGWQEPASNFTTEDERVYYNVAASFYETFITNKWYRPDGTRENDPGTNLLAHPVYEKGLFIGFWTYMVINGKDRQPGQWRVEHWVLDISYKWHLMCTSHFTIMPAEDLPGVVPPALLLLLEDI
jgi:hypothetical protein